MQLIALLRLDFQYNKLLSSYVSYSVIDLFLGSELSLALVSNLYAKILTLFSSYVGMI